MPKYDELRVAIEQMQEIIHDIRQHASKKADKKLSGMIDRLDGLLAELTGDLSILLKTK